MHPQTFSRRSTPALLLTCALLGVASASCTAERAEREESDRERREREHQREEAGPIPSYAGFFGNLGFEAGEENEGDEHEIAVAWKGGGSGYEFALENTAAHSGKYAGRLTRVRDDIPKINSFGAITQCASAEPFRGKKLRYTAWVKTKDVSGGFCGLYMRVDGPGLRPLSFENMESRPIGATTDWTRHEITLDIPNNADGFCFGLVLTGSGTAWLDDVKFERVDSTPK